jgi:hypothetical protein
MMISRRVCVGLWAAAWLCASACSSGNDVSPSSKTKLPAHTGAAGGSGKSAGKGAAGGTEMRATAGRGVTNADTNTGSDAPAMSECDLHTKYAGDEYCILPPPPDKGFQLHIGPSNYDNPEAQYLLAPGQEATTNYSAVSTNTEMKYFYYRQFRQRPGAHHNIITTGSVGGLLGGSGGLSAAGLDFNGNRIGTSNLLSEDSPKGGMIAPENQDVGIAIGPQTPINVSLHSINTSQDMELREIWVNFWYVDPDQVKEPVQELFAIGDPTLAVAPGTDVVLGPYTCNVTGSGRMLWFYGHRHANNVRFSAWRVRGSQRDLFYEAYYWEEPLVLEYSSTVQNPAVDAAKGVEGGWSGVLDMAAGDSIQWECHVINKTSGTLRFTNNTYTGEMCIMDAELVGANCR